jgi:hypothetical protein
MRFRNLHVVGDEAVYLAAAAADGLGVAVQNNICVNTKQWWNGKWQGITEVLGERLVPVPLCTTEIHWDCLSSEGVRIQIVAVCALQEYRGSRGVAPLILNLGTGWIWVQLYLRKGTPILVDQEADWAW